MFGRVLNAVEGGVGSDGVEAPTRAAERDDDCDRRDHYEQRSGTGQSQQARRRRSTGHRASPGAAVRQPRSPAATARHAAATPRERPRKLPRHRSVAEFQTTSQTEIINF